MHCCEEAVLTIRWLMSWLSRKNHNCYSYTFSTVSIREKLFTQSSIFQSILVTDFLGYWPLISNKKRILSTSQQGEVQQLNDSRWCPTCFCLNVISSPLILWAQSKRLSIESSTENSKMDVWWPMVGKTSRLYSQWIHDWRLYANGSYECRHLRLLIVIEKTYRIFRMKWITAIWWIFCKMT